MESIEKVGFESKPVSGRPVVFKNGLKTVAVRIPINHKNALDEESSITGLPIAEIVRRLVADHLSNNVQLLAATGGCAAKF